ncbi:YsnF/AvaK domain-containing protein [Alkalihalobacterium chitinilyticum]|uniref:YsnF/AvaK domain-containing protein n=1 Tax=Alkalihalobacterium chitinilyticum TaxID=2980103 RepID=A0ABT5VHF1_9BACI|nr:YsnF/AvaK domain-containing protein [Alkalihalobacterium chitinilyticum]MDE5413654.1 YsnF/AvaK domain-containing protein [Alkalihalobacterium chitinilyticum]
MGKSILIGAILGSLIGWVMGFTIFSGIIVGAIVGGIFFSLFTKRTTTQLDEKNKQEEQTIQLREEELDIEKERVQTGEVKIHKEVVEEQKTITVPIRRQEMVIEAGDEEQYRIPLKEEEIEIHKHPVKLNDVSISKQEVTEIQQVKATVKKETADVDIDGTVDVARNNEQQ